MPAALTLSPALSAMLLKPPSERKDSFMTPFYNGFNKVFARATKGYMGIATMFTRKLIISIGTLGIMVVLMGGFPLVCFAIGALLFSRFDLTEAEHARIRAELDERAAADTTSA